MQIKKLYSARLVLDTIIFLALLSFLGFVSWYAWPILRSFRLEQDDGPFEVRACNGITEETYLGTGPVQFTGNLIYFTDEAGVRHRISGGMIIFKRFDSMEHKAEAIFNVLRVPVIYDQKLIDSLARAEQKASISKPKRKYKTRRK